AEVCHANRACRAYCAVAVGNSAGGRQPLCPETGQGPLRAQGPHHRSQRGGGRNARGFPPEPIGFRTNRGRRRTALAHEGAGLRAAPGRSAARKRGLETAGGTAGVGVALLSEHYAYTAARSVTGRTTR